MRSGIASLPCSRARAATVGPAARLGFQVVDQGVVTVISGAKRGGFVTRL
jgi:hypothetical protein